ncbi:MAG TPA: hypothetical protein VFB62_10975, partial [Polyangiaceae bacterium]|nr:hypothetical protein [Polyangiaceae bacterium]
MRLLLLIVLLVGCGDEAPAPPPTPTKPAAAPRGSFETVTADALARALRAAERLEKGAPMEKAYAELREALAES